jgi:hypothetical protein
MKERLIKIMVALIAIFLLNSCGVLFYGTKQKVELNSSPAGAEVYVNGTATNQKTPCEVKVNRKVKATENNKKNQYNYVFKKDGYEDFLTTDNAKFNYVTIIDMPYYFVPFICDVIAGSQWKYNKLFTANLAPSQVTAPQETITFRSQDAEPPKTTETLNNVGKYYALIIGNNVYQDASIPSLDGPIKDATRLYNVLTTKYTFDIKNIIFLKNATYEQMIQALDELSNKVTKNDNLIVFYAGHGVWDEAKDLGYWLPIDAKKSNTAYWIPNSRISDYMNSIKSKHTLLIADACFSGSIFKTRRAFSDAQPSINKLYELPSKKAMTSGTLKEVPDKSVFLKFLVDRLSDNKEKYLSSDMLFSSFRQAVLNNSPTEPQYGTIQNAGDEGGEFIFVTK